MRIAMPSLKIACQGADTLPYTELTEFQGELKSLSKSDFEAMRRQLVENGFSFPIALWVSPEGKNCILDGHQRLRVIRELAKEGWTIPELPVTWVDADNEQQAKEKLLAAAGAFGTVSDQGLYELITSADLDIDRIAEMTRFREIDFDVFKEEFFIDLNQSDSKSDNVENIYTQKIEAPIYTPKGDKPSEKELYETQKTDELISQIESFDLPKEIKKFLRIAAYRHTVFDYEKIAEYYAHSSHEVQNLMEKSALVIIDFDKAIENGFVQMSTVIAEMYGDEHESNE